MNFRWLVLLLFSAPGCLFGPGEDGFDAGPIEEPVVFVDVPDNEYCEPVNQWEAEYTDLEEELLVLVNEVRAAGANCGSQGTYAPTHPLIMNGALRCAARVHCVDMDQRQFFSHTNPSGETAAYRIAQAGFGEYPIGENIAMGSSTAEAVMLQWLNSDGHCGNIMQPHYYFFGAAYYQGAVYGHLWTQTFGGKL